MIWDSRVEVHVYNQPTDMRKSHDGLASICQHAIGCNPLSSQVFVFMSKRRDRLKSLTLGMRETILRIRNCRGFQIPYEYVNQHEAIDLI